jgi:hypothetical protein
MNDSIKYFGNYKRDASKASLFMPLSAGIPHPQP